MSYRHEVKVSGSSQLEVREDEKKGFSLGTKVMGAVGVVGALAGMGALSMETGSPIANATKCEVIGGARDGSGEGVMAAYGAQGQLNQCDEGVDVVQYSGDFSPNGSLKENEAVPPAAADLASRLENTPPWQHKVVLGFSEGSMVGAMASNDPNITNVEFQLQGNPEGRTGIFNSAIYNFVPLVRQVSEMVGIDDTTPLNPRPGVEITRIYSKGDLFANAEPQGLQPDALIGGATEMVQNGAHSIEDPENGPVIARFVDGDGVNNIVIDDGDPATRVGDHDLAVMAPPEFGPVPLPDLFNLPLQVDSQSPPAPDFVPPQAPDLPPAPDFVPPPPVDLAPPPAPDVPAPDLAPAA